MRKGLFFACILFAIVAIGCKKESKIDVVADPLKEKAKLIVKGVWKTSDTPPGTYAFTIDVSGIGGDLVYRDDDSEDKAKWKLVSITELQMTEPDGSTFSYTYTVSATALTLNYGGFIVDLTH